jgi:hypothetical protein
MSTAKLLVVFGLAFVAVSLLWRVIEAGCLPRDIVSRARTIELYIPLATSLLISIVLSLVLWLLNR